MAVDSFRFPLRGSNKRGARIGTTPDRPSTIDFLFGIPPLLISFELYSLSLFLFFFASFLERGEIDIFSFSHVYFTLYFSYSRVRIYKREREARCSLFRWEVKIRYFIESTILFLFFLTRIFYEFSVYRLFVSASPNFLFESGWDR